MSWCCGFSSSGQDAPASVPSVLTPRTLIDDVYDALPSSSFLGGGTVVINGRTWTILNQARATTFGITTAQGLNFVFDGGAATDWTNSVRTATAIRLPYASIPGYDPRGSYIAELHWTISTQINGDRLQMGLVLDTTGTDGFAGAGRRTTAAFAGGYAIIGTNITNPPDSVGTNTDDAHCLLWTPQGVNSFSGVYGSDFPTAYPRCQGMATYGTTTPVFDVPVDPGYTASPGGLVIAFPSAVGSAHAERLQRFRLSRVA